VFPEAVEEAATVMVPVSLELRRFNETDETTTMTEVSMLLE
jgi:hypothetical protein